MFMKSGFGRPYIGFGARMVDNAEMIPEPSWLDITHPNKWSPDRKESNSLFAVCGCLNNCIESRLRLTAAIEKQRIVGAPSHRPVVQPGIPVRHAPEGYAVDSIAMLQIDPE